MKKAETRLRDLFTLLLTGPLCCSYAAPASEHPPRDARIRLVDKQAQAAQTTQRSTPASNQNQTLELEPIEVTGTRARGNNVLPRDNILPTSRSFDSLFGTKRSAVATPRSASVLSRTLLDRANVTEIQDISRVSSNTFSPNVFGVTSLPTIRGDLGEIFQDGLRRVGGNNGFGFPTSFNSVEQIDVVKGPPPVFLGPTQRVGGFINLVSKKPYFDKFRGDAELEGGSFGRRRARFDLGGPIVQGESGYRLSYEHVDDDSFYDFAHTKSDDIYFATAYAPSNKLRFDFNFEYYNAEFPDIAGINRATQDLIDNGTYITGTGVSPDPAFAGIPGPGAVISPTGETQLPRSQVLNDPGDRADSDDMIVGLTASYDINPRTQLTNRSSFQNLSKTAIERNSFVEIIDEDYVVQNRTELAHSFRSSFGGFDIGHQTIGGIDFRYSHVKGFSQFDTEADNPIDLTAPVEIRRIPLPPEIRQQLVFLNSEGVFVSPGASYDVNGDGENDFLISDTTGSDAYQLGLFLQDDLRLSERWSLLLGLRGDAYHVSAEDPIPPPGFAAASDSTTQFNPSANGSLIYRPTHHSSVYATYNYTEATINSLGGGYTLDANNELPDQNFNTVSELYEVGTKFSLLDDSLFLSLAGFDQTRSLRNRDGSISGIKTLGGELELAYQPNRNFFTNFNLSYLDARFDNSSDVQDTGVINDAFDNSRPDIIQGTGVGSPNFTVFPPSNDPVPGLPNVLLSAFAGYNFDFGLGFDLGVVATDSYRLDHLNTVRIPAQYTLNGGISYRYKRVEARADFFNITNQDNFSPVFGGFFGATDVFPEQPFNYLVSLRYNF